MKTNKKYQLNEIADRIEPLKSVDKEGRVSFPAFEIEVLRSVLESAVEFDAEIPNNDARGIIWGAITDAAKKGVVTGKSLAAQLNRREQAYLRQPVTKWVLLTNLSIRPIKGIGSFQFSGSKIQLSAGRPPRFDRSEVQRRCDDCLTCEYPEPFLWARVAVEARTSFHANQIASHRLDLLRAFWTFRLIQRTVSLFRAGVPKPLNQIRCGPVSTLHRPGGALATKTIWYELADTQHPKAADLEARWPDLRSEDQRLRKLLRRLSYRTELEEAFVRYVRALDSNHWDVVFIRLWSILERLTGTGDRRYDVTVARALFLVGEREYHRQLIEHLRDVRNGIVHHDKFHEAIETYAFQLKWFVERLFLFHLHHGPDFESSEEACAFLDLPHDPVLLSRRSELIAKALRFRS